jgi:peroxiredoxin
MPSKNFTISIILCFFFTLLVASTVGISHNYISNYFHTSGGFDYTSRLNDKEYDWRGPEIGEKIAVQFYKDKVGNSLLDSINSDIVVLATVDENCRFSRLSMDQMEYIQTTAKSNGIDYLLVSFNLKISPTEFFDFAQSLNSSTKSFAWFGNESEMLASLPKMIVPSHLIINKTGEILRVFPGTDVEKQTRDRMANQIVAEMLEEKAKFDVKN